MTATQYRHPLASLLFPLALLTACSSAPELAINLRTDLQVGLEIDEVQVTIDGVTSAPRALERSADLVTGTRIHETSLAVGRHVIEVGLRHDGDTVMRREYVLRIEGSLIMVAVLTRDCRGVECPGSGGSASETQCLAGRCVDPSCIAVGDPSCPPDLDPCSETECTAVVACLTASCTAGVCFQTSSCGANASCSFASAMCEPDVVETDAGPTDGGPTDDVGPTDGGTEPPPPDTGAAVLPCATRCADGCPAIDYTFQVITDAGTGDFGIGEPVFGDIDADGDLDILAPSGRNVVAWSTGPDGLTYLGPVGITAPRPIARIAAADFDVDGAVDLFVLHQDCLEARANRGRWLSLTGSVCAPFTYVPPLAAGDLDSDGQVDDVLVGSPAGVTPFRTSVGSADILFDAGLELAVGSVSTMSMGDLDGDGITDAVVARASDLLTLRGAAGTLSVGATVAFGGTARHMVVAPMFCDMLPSVLVDGAAGDAVWVRSVSGSAVSTVLPGSASSGIVVADLDGDALPDVLTLEPGAGVRVLRATNDEVLVDDRLIPVPAVGSGLTRAADGRLAAVGVAGELVLLTPR